MRRKKKVKTVLEASEELLAVLQRFGTWDDGCFYYNGVTSSELQTPIQDLADAIGKVKKGTVE